MINQKEKCLFLMLFSWDYLRKDTIISKQVIFEHRALAAMLI